METIESNTVLLFEWGGGGRLENGKVKVYKFFNNWLLWIDLFFEFYRGDPLKLVAGEHVKYQSNFISILQETNKNLSIPIPQQLRNLRNLNKISS